MIFWIASYPKSGNTWLRTLISSYYYSKDGIFNHDLIKNIGQFPEKDYFKDFPLDTKNVVGTTKYWIKAQEKYRSCEVDYSTYLSDLENRSEDLKFTDLELIFKDLKSLFEKRGYVINWKALEKQKLDETINALAMASPFSLEEKQVLLEAENLSSRKNKIAEILSTYSHDVFENTTLQ